jgi:hypothetical protein
MEYWVPQNRESSKPTIPTFHSSVIPDLGNAYEEIEPWI